MLRKDNGFGSQHLALFEKLLRWACTQIHIGAIAPEDFGIKLSDLRDTIRNGNAVLNLGHDSREPNEYSNEKSVPERHYFELKL